MAERIVSPGVRYDRLVVVGLSGRTRGRLPYWTCLCDCGKEKEVNQKELIRGETRSCGCYRREKMATAKTTHGQSGTRPYDSWCAMIARCKNKNNRSYKDYGGRGITVCERWSGSGGYENFIQDMGERPEGMTLDRIDNNGPYSPENCRWATAIVQGNNKRDSRIVECFGKKMSLSDWSRETGICAGVLWMRIAKLDWTAERAMSRPVRKIARRSIT